jgi:hypothetical protein
MLCPSSAHRHFLSRGLFYFISYLSTQSTGLAYAWSVSRHCRKGVESCRMRENLPLYCPPSLVHRLLVSDLTGANSPLEIQEVVLPGLVLSPSRVSVLSLPATGMTASL